MPHLKQIVAGLAVLALVAGCSKARPAQTPGVTGTAPVSSPAVSDSPGPETEPAETGLKPPAIRVPTPAANPAPTPAAAGSKLWVLSRNGRKEAAGHLPTAALGGALSPDGTQVAVLRPVASRETESFREFDTEVDVVRLSTGERWETGHLVRNSYELVWSPDGKFLVMLAGRQACVSDIAARTVTCLPDPVAAAAWSPDGKRLALLSRAAGTDAKAPLDLVLLGWPQKTEQRFKGIASVVNSGGIEVGSLAFSPDGTQLAIPGGNDLLIVNSVSGGVSAQLPGAFTTHTRTMTWSPDGRLLAVAARLADVTTRRLSPIALPESPRPERHLSPAQHWWSPDSSVLVVQSEEHYPDAFSWAWYDPVKGAGELGDATLVPLGFRSDGRLLAVTRNDGR